MEVLSKIMAYFRLGIRCEFKQSLLLALSLSLSLYELF
jgi:hypothetical protein